MEEPNPFDAPAQPGDEGVKSGQKPGGWIGNIVWSVLALLTTLSGQLIYLIVHAQPVGDRPSFYFASLAGQFIGGFLCPAIPAGIFLFWKRFRSYRSFIKIYCAVSGLVLLSACAQLGNRLSKNPGGAIAPPTEATP